MSNPDWRGVDDEDGEEDEEQVYEAYSGRDSLIILIDCTKPMFIKIEDEESAFDLCIKCAKNVMSNKIVSSDKDLIGIVFFGTEKTKNSADFKHITVFQDLSQPGAESILEVEKLTKGGSDEFTKEYGHSNNFVLSEALWTCSSIFSNCSTKLGSKRILLFTNTDDPHANNVQAQHQASQKAHDLFEIGIELDLMHLKQPDKAFNVAKFYRDLIFVAEDEEYDQLPDAAVKFDELMSRVRTKDHKKRSLGKLSFTLGDGLSLGIGVYTLVRPMNKGYPVRLSKASNEDLRTMRKQYLAETGEILFPSDIHKYQLCGGRKIVMDQDEVKEVHKFYDPGLVLLGFKPRNCLKPYYHVKGAQFIYPEEGNVRGSTQLFAALLQKCIDREVIPICRYTARRNLPPRFVALLPQEEELDENNVQITPPGFHVIFLPFADDIRKLDLDAPVRATQIQVEKAKEIVKKLQFNFDSDAFENPALQTHWRYIEALALDRDDVEKIEDFTKPNHKMMAKRAGKLVADFKGSVFPPDYDSTKGKRKPATGGEGRAAKRAKDDKQVDIDFKREAELGRVDRLTVDVLKTFCSKSDIRTTGKRKAQLVSDVYAYFKVTPPK